MRMSRICVWGKPTILAHEIRAPVVILDEFSAVVRVRRLYSGKPCLVKCIFSLGALKWKTLHLFYFLKFCIIIHTDKKGTEMTDHEFYAQIQEDYFREFAGAELSEVFVCTNDHDEFFEFDDVPY